MAAQDPSNSQTAFHDLRITCAKFRQNLVRGGILPRLPESRALVPSEVHPQDLNEAQVRQSYILPLIDSLGWDVSDPYEVFPEERAGGGFIDIRTQLSRTNSIIWEIKRTSVSLDLGTPEGKEAAYQAVGYGRTFTHSPYCVVTNFEMTHVLHSYSTPSRDRIMDNVVASFSWLDIESGRADEIISLLTKTATSDGTGTKKFDTLVRDRRLLRSRRPLEKRILKDLESWRLQIAGEIYRVTGLTDLGEIDHSTQAIINRILFIRCCEDRGFDRPQIRPLLEGEGLWASLASDIFSYFRLSYNSDLFANDKFADNHELGLSDDVIRFILEGSFTGTGAETHEVYDFSIIPLEVLGAAYENYLAKRLELNDSGELVLITKPEIVKSGGVCYTPNFIVDEIVRSAIGSIEQKGKKFLPKVLDPACGSGTFLIQALRYLFDRNRPEPEKKSEIRLPLTLKEKKEILEKCIFGADIDERAVEITKLSLLLLLLEGTVEGILVKSALLPSLNRNIRSGNSLISPSDALRITPDVNLEELKPLDWSSFKEEVGAAAGFDAVIGNPPYVRIQVLQEYFPKETTIYCQAFASAGAGNVDLYLPFIEQAINLVRAGGRIGYIVPHRFWSNDYGRNLRNRIAESGSLSQVLNFRAEQVFDNVSTYTCVVVFHKRANPTFEYSEPPAKGTPPEAFVAHLNKKPNELTETLSAEILSEDPWLLAPQIVRERILLLESSEFRLGEVFEPNSGIFQGLINGADQVFLLSEKDGGLFSEQLERSVQLEATFLFPVLKGSAALKQLKRPETTQRILYPYQLNSSGQAQLLALDVIRRLAPKTAEYIDENERCLRLRPSLKTKRNREADLRNDPEKYIHPEDPRKLLWFYDHADFFKYVRNQALECVLKPKLIVPSMFREPAFFWDENGTYALTGSGSGGGGAYAGYLLPEFVPIAKAIVAILSSAPLAEWFERRGDLFSGYYIGVDEPILKAVPMPNLRDANIRPQIELLMRLHDQALAAAESNNVTLKREIMGSIDTIVRQLFGRS